MRTKHEKKAEDTKRHEIRLYTTNKEEQKKLKEYKKKRTKKRQKIT